MCVRVCVCKCICACICVYVCICVAIRKCAAMCYRVAKTHRISYLYRSFSTKVTYIYVALLRTMICNLGDPMSLRHPVSIYTYTHAIRFSHLRDQQSNKLRDFPFRALFSLSRALSLSLSLAHSLSSFLAFMLSLTLTSLSRLFSLALFRAFLSHVSCTLSLCLSLFSLSLSLSRARCLQCWHYWRV